MQIRWTCPSCGRWNACARPPSPGTAPPCRGCGARLEFARAGAARPGEPIGSCAVCGDDKFYLVKDFDQRIGCLIVAIGAALVPWTYGVSLAVCALADLLLYRALPTLPACYVCGARYRGVAPSADLGPYDLMTAQTYEARSLAWRRRHDRLTGAPRSP